MKVAVLCNGPSRTVYKGRGDYEFVMGCNIPWSTDVDATVVIDKNVVSKWFKEQHLINVPTYFSRRAWSECINRERRFFREYSKGLIDVGQEYDSSGHCAVRVVLSLGATNIDIYGCDSMFKETTVSYTNTFIPKSEFKNVKKQTDGWKNTWNNIISKHPDVRFNFIGENDEIISY